MVPALHAAKWNNETLLNNRADLFTSGSALSNAVTQVCEVSKDDEPASIAAFEERSSKARERFIALAKRYWDTLPSSSTGGTVTDSIHGNEAAENLVDIIWTVDQAFENGQNNATTAAVGGGNGAPAQLPNEKKPVYKLGLLVKDLNVSTCFLRCYAFARTDSIDSAMNVEKQQTLS